MSGIQKSFVIKHGLEVSTNLILANADTRKVGIGSTNPQYTLDVRGGIGVTDINAVGIVTVLTRLNVGTNGSTLTAIGGSYVGIGTAVPAYLLDVRSPVSTGATGLYVYGDARITGDLVVGDDITLDEVTVRNITVTNQETTLYSNVTGISTIATLGVTGTSTARNFIVTGVSTIATLGVTGLTTTQNLNVTGIATIATLNATGIAVTNFTVYNNLSVGGISTFTNGTIFVGSGTSTGTASQPLQVTGGAYVSGNLGIGTTTPASKLHVIGDVRVSGVVTATTFVGALTGTASSTTNIPNLTGAITSVNTTTSLGSFTSAQLATALTDETGSGVAVFATSPTLVTPVLGAATATNIVVGSGVTINASGINASGIVTASTFVGALTGTASSTTNIPNLTGDITSVNKATTLATVNSNVGTFGGTDAIPVVTVNGKGLVTGVSTVAPNNGTLTLAVSGTGLSGSASFTANQSGSSSFTVTSNATNANTVSTIVARDGSGNFSAGTITATLSGTATSTTNIPNLTGAITSVNTTTSLGSFTSAQLATALTDETGSGSAVFATSPTLVTPVLGAATATSIVVGSGVTINASGINASGIITATGGINAIGIQSAGVVIASGIITALNFVGTGNTVIYNSATKTVDISISGGGGISSVSFATTSFGLSGTPNLNVGITTVTQLGINTTTNPTKLYVQGNAASNIVTLTDGATITPDFTLGNNFQVTIAASRTIANPTGVTTGQSGVIFIQENGTGGYTVAWGTSWDFTSSTAPTLITTANALNALPYFARSTTSIVVGSVISGIGTL